MRKHMTGEQFAERYNSCSDEVSNAITFGPDRPVPRKRGSTGRSRKLLAGRGIRIAAHLSLNPLADPAVGVAYTQLSGGGLADHLSTTGHVCYDDPGLDIAL